MTTIIAWEDDVDMINLEDANYIKNGMDSWYLSPNSAHNLGDMSLHNGHSYSMQFG